MNDYLTGSNTNLSNAFKRALDKLGGGDGARQQPAADAPARGAADSRSSCSATAAAPSSR